MKKIKSLFETPKKAILTGICAIPVLVILGSGSAYAATNIAEKTSIGAESARNFAYADAGIDPVTATPTKTEFDFEKGQFVYEVDFYANGIKYEYLIKASDGSVVKRELEQQSVKEQQGKTEKQKNPGVTASTGTNATTDTTATTATTGATAKQTLTEEGAADEATTQITLEEAKAIALKDAGLATTDIKFTKVELDQEHYDHEYDIEFYTATHEYEYEILATNGTIKEKSVEPLQKEKVEYQKTEQKAKNDQINKDQAQIDQAQKDQAQIDQAKKEQEKQTAPSDTGNYIGIDQAKAIAAQHVGQAVTSLSFTKAKLDKDDGKVVYEVEFYKDGVEYDYEIDASSGAILEFDSERD